MLEAEVKILAFLFPLRCHEALIQRPQLVGIGVHFDDQYMEHAFYPLPPHVPDEQVFPLVIVHLSTWMVVVYFRLGLNCLPSPQGATWCDEGVVAHVSWR